jgi:hypothetical protein
MKNESTYTEKELKLPHSSPSLQHQHDRLAYPALNVYFSPRVFRDRIDQRSTPLRHYTKPVRATNI